MNKTTSTDIEEVKNNPSLKPLRHGGDDRYSIVMSILKDKDNKRYARYQDCGHDVIDEEKVATVIVSYVDKLLAPHLSNKSELKKEAVREFDGKFVGTTPDDLDKLFPTRKGDKVK